MATDLPNKALPAPNNALPAPQSDADDRPLPPRDSPTAPRRSPWRISLREVMGVAVIVALTLAYLTLLSRFREAERELSVLRSETGYLPPTDDGRMAAARLPSNEPLTYRVRVRVPEENSYRVAYSSVVPEGRAAPAWFAAADLPPGESVVTVRVAEDPRDGRWKIATLIRSRRGNKRVATTLPDDHVAVFRATGEILSSGIGQSAVEAEAAGSIRLLDERWLVGDGALLLYGDRPAERDQVGVYAELQPGDQPL